MKKHLYLFIALILCFQNSNAQDATAAATTYYSDDFNWTLNVPAGFEKVPAEQWTKMQGRGKAAIEKTMDQDIVNNSKIIFVFKSDKSNYFEASYQAFDPKVDGSLLESIKGVNEVLYQTFVSQMPDVKIARSVINEKIDGLSFNLSRFDVTYPNKMVLHIYMFTHLFGKKEFTVNVMYIDEAKGKEMLGFWRASKFGKK